MEAIPDIPERITVQLERAAFIRRKLIDRVADDNCEDEIGKRVAVVEWGDFYTCIAFFRLYAGKKSDTSHFYTFLVATTFSNLCLDSNLTAHPLYRSNSLCFHCCRQNGSVGNQGVPSVRGRVRT